MSDLRRLKRLLPYLRRDRRRLFTALLLLPLSGALAVQPLLVGQVIAVLRGENAWGWLQAMEQGAAL